MRVLTILVLVALLSSCGKNVIKPAYFEIEVQEQGHVVLISASTEVESEMLSAGDAVILKGTELTLLNMGIKDTKVLVGGKEYIIESESKIILN